MAFVRKRTTKSGRVITALIESYRDENGRPRQRTLANLYGADDALAALAKLAAQRERLRDEKKKLAPEVKAAAEFYATVTQNALSGHKYGAVQRRAGPKGVAQPIAIEVRWAGGARS